MKKSIVSKLLPEQISAFWEVFKYALDATLVPITKEHPDKLNRILAAALSGKIELWAGYVKEEGKPSKFEVIGVTQFLYDEPSDTKNLLIYALYGYNQVDPTSWARMLAALSRYAKEKKCNQIIAYTKVPHLINVAKGLGADTDYTFISFDVDETVKKLNNLME